VYQRHRRVSVARDVRRSAGECAGQRSNAHHLHRRQHAALVPRPGAGRSALRRTEERGHSSTVDRRRRPRRVQLVRDVLTQLQRVQPQSVLQLESSSDGLRKRVSGPVFRVDIRPIAVHFNNRQ